MKKALGATVMSLLLAISLVPFLGVQDAYADELSDAQATLDDASAKLDTISAEYNTLQGQLSDLDAEIATTLENVQEAQQAMLDGQKVLGDAVLAEYKSDGGLSLVNIILSSDSVSDFVTNMTYYSAIQKDQARIIEEQRQLNETFNKALEDLNAKRDDQQTVLDQVQAKKAEAEKVVSDASAKVSSIKESQAALAALKAKAEQATAAKTASSSQQSVSPNWNTNVERPAANGGVVDSGKNEGSSNASSGNSGSSSNGSSSNSSSSSDSTKGWKTGLASAYGGSSDHSVSNPAYTANGSICNDSSMGVAVPMSWPNYRSYFGRAVEIKYGGKTVIATINDCGGLAGGARSLDLQPGVFKAFGYSTCQAWGVRTVSYRIL